MREDSQVTAKLEKAKLWVKEAGQFLRQNISKPLEITEKTRYDDLVTNFDCAVQDQIIGEILKAYPEDLILAEEDQVKTKFSAEIPHLWVLDPIDGTTNFIVRKDNFAVMLAYYEYGKGQFGLILDVMKDKLYWCDAQNAYCDERQLKATAPNLRQSLLGVNAYMYRTNTGGLLDLSLQTLGIRCCGSAGISYTELLEGKLVGYVSNLQPWDYAAGTIISEKLGFTTKALNGLEPHYDGREMIYTVPKSLLEQVQKYLH